MTPPDGRAPPNTIPWPPILYAGAAGVAALIGWLLPLRVGLPTAVTGAGALAMALGLALDLGAMVAMRRHRANILPHRAATALVTAFPFSISRNPIYLGNTIMLAGAAPTFDNPWFLVMTALVVPAITTLAIKREEAHLDAMFGAAWTDYAARVGRWLSL